MWSRRSESPETGIQSTGGRAITIQITATNSIGSGQNFFVGWIPAQHASETVAVYGHAAGHRDPEGKVKRTVRLIAGAHAVQKVLDVRNVEVLLSLIDRPPQNHGPLWPVDLLRQVSNLFAPEDSPVGTKHVFGHSQLVVSEGRVPGEHKVLRVNHRRVHGIRHFPSVLPEEHSAIGRDPGRNPQV